MLGDIGVSRRMVARAGVVPKMCYAPEQHGFSDSRLHRMRVITADAMSAKAMGRNIGVALMLGDGVHGSLDPAFEAHVWPMYF